MNIFGGRGVGRVLCLEFWGIISDFLFLDEPLLGKTHSSNYLAYSSYITLKPKKKKKKIASTALTYCTYKKNKAHII